MTLSQASLVGHPPRGFRILFNPKIMSAMSFHILSSLKIRTATQSLCSSVVGQVSLALALDQAKQMNKDFFSGTNSCNMQISVRLHSQVTVHLHSSMAENFCHFYFTNSNPYLLTLKTVFYYTHWLINGIEC